MYKCKSVCSNQAQLDTSTLVGPRPSPRPKSYKRTAWWIGISTKASGFSGGSELVIGRHTMLQSQPLPFPGGLSFASSCAMVLHMYDFLYSPQFSGKSIVIFIFVYFFLIRASQVAVVIPLRRIWQPTLVFLSGKSHGQKNLEIYSP